MNIKKNDKQNLICFLSGLVLGAAIFVLIFGFSTLDVTDDRFIQPGFVEADLTQHYTGFMLYRSSEWQFPLGVGANLTYPYGSPVSFSDSIPIFAIVAKALSPMLPETFQYFGWFSFFSFSLQGGFSALLLSLFIDRKSKTSFYTVVLSGAALFCLAPILVERTFRHTALSAMWIITLSLYLYFVSKRNGKFHKAFYAIAFFAITVHPYFLPLTYAVMFAYLVEDAVVFKKYKQNILTLLVCFGLTVASAIFIGYLSGGAPVSEGGYGWFSLNLNALYNPLSKGFDNWSRILPPLPQTNGNLDGFNYLGLGVIAANVILAVAFLFQKQKLNKIKQFAHRYFGMVFVVAVLLIFAFSNVLTFNGHQLFGLAIPFKTVYDLLSVFRASGRMAWVLYYLLFLVAVVGIYRLAKKFSWRHFNAANVFGAFAVVLLVLIQLFDISKPLIEKANYFTQFETGDITTKGFSDGKPVESENIDFDFWLEATKGRTAVVALDDKDPGKRVELGFCAAKNDTPVNIYFFGVVANSEQKQEQIESLTKTLQSGKLKDGILTVATDYDEFLQTVDGGSNEFELYMKDGFLFPLAQNDMILSIEDSGIVKVDQTSFFASDISGGGYESGVNANLSIIAVLATERNKQLLISQTPVAIENQQGESVAVVSAVVDGEYINLTVEQGADISGFKFPALNTVHY